MYLWVWTMTGKQWMYSVYPDSSWALVKFSKESRCEAHLLAIPFAFQMIFEPAHDKTRKMACAPSEDSDQTGHPPSLIRVFAVRMRTVWVLRYPLSAQQRLIWLGGCSVWSESSLGAWGQFGSLDTHWAHNEDWSDWVDAQADLSLRWAHMLFCRFCHALAHFWNIHNRLKDFHLRGMGTFCSFFTILKRDTTFFFNLINSNIYIIVSRIIFRHIYVFLLLMFS